MTDTIAKPALPPEAHLSMPRQTVHADRRPVRGRLKTLRWLGTIFARTALIGGTGALTAYGVSEMYAVMTTGKITPLQWLFLVLFSVNFAWVSFAGCQAVLGFFLILKRDLFGRHFIHDRIPGLQTAVLVPVYNEDPVRVGAAISAMADGLVKNAPGRFCFFILSDSNQPKAWLREEHVFHQLMESADANCPIYYRHRTDNAERKAGNISDWVTRWGGAYEAMLILDADSIMSPETMVEMARRMEDDDGLGLLQSLPSIVLADSLYARLQQFANRRYGLIFGNGLSAWHGNSSNFWGHNAIIRTKAFAESARLPILKGNPPFGGHVISHDFIEAALLRRAGWSVRFDTDLQETYEEAPPSVSDVITRDRRWCQGNLQHIRFLFADGLAFTSRLHILSGIMAYMSALFWCLLLVVGLTLAIQASFTRPEYFARPSLFPTWPVFDSVRAVKLFILSMGIVLAPKILSWTVAIINPFRCFRYGGPVFVTLGVLTEIILSALYAPIMMIAQSRIVWEIMTGGDSGWQPQRRGDGSIGFMAALHAHRWHMLIGLGAATITLFLHKDLFLWMLPVTGGLMLAPLLSWLSGRRDIGRLLRMLGLLRTPEEKNPPAILKAVQDKLETGTLKPFTSPLLTLAESSDFHAWHLAQLNPKNSLADFNTDLVLAEAKMARAKTIPELERWLSNREAMALLNDYTLVAKLPKWAKAHTG
ncbi:glucans biosynthesis glucosyltransferase MdoH [Kordiimonas pumila]|uniref:Glucans biosynthesis glucosyltransferase H n=1 Tax=Kordiimonas pumila TaxID=2161677 RepID=A0ABV7D2U3_9PROT|nr:glucans biosynthesis glucosyltransferase MdoH [Kordiimonas pumila]